MIKAGTVITALEEKVNQAGVTRVRFNKGWLSVKSGDGTVLLKKQAADESEEETEEETEEEETSEEESEYESGSEYEETSEDEEVGPEQYRVMANSKIRAGFAMTSKDKGMIKAGTVVKALEERVNNAGITRVRCAQGWLSVKSSDGTVLLKKAGSTDTEEETESEYEDSDEESEYEVSEAPERSQRARSISICHM
jgi:hypothetical protein